jgi:hypothetical protein
VPEELFPLIALLSSATAVDYCDGPFIVIVKTREEFSHWLGNEMPGLECIQVEGLIGDPETWALAAQGTDEIPLDVVLDDPATEYSALYRLVDVRMVRPVRVTVPAKPGFLKALRLAASIQIPVRLLPGQPDTETVIELIAAANFYLRDSMVEAPMEFFHSVFAVFRGMGEGTLWDFLEEEPGVCLRQDGDGRPLRAPDSIETHLAGLLQEGAECVECRWQSICAGYFKYPDPTYACIGVKEVFASLESAAEEITRDLAECRNQLS